MDNVTIESLKKVHGDNAESVYAEVAQIGGFGNEKQSGGLDLTGLDTKTREKILAILTKKESK